MLIRRLPTAFLLLSVLFFFACSSSTDVTSPTFEASFSFEDYRAGDFYALPWPSEFRRTEAGKVDLRNLPARETNFILSTYLPVLEDRVADFSPNGAILFFLNATLETETLPADAAATLSASGTVQLINVEPGSARFAERIPVEVKFSPFPGSFQPTNTLTLVPVGGFPMAMGEHYAAILTSRLQSPAGALTQSAALEHLLESPASAPEAKFSLLVDALAEIEVKKTDIAAATVFRVSDPTRSVRLAREVIYAEKDAPAAAVWEADTKYPLKYCKSFENANFDLVKTDITIPSFLSGEAPYLDLGTGVLVLDETGAPQIQGEEAITVTVSVPDGPPPAGGFPVAIYMHGAGGYRYSFVRDGTACSLAQRGIAGVAIDFPLHGDRNPPPKHDVLYQLVNPENVPSALDVELQAAIDLFSVARFFATGPTIPSAAAGKTAPLRPTGIGFIGHSQGSFVGVPFLAFEKTVSAGILSGSGAHFLTFLTDRIAGESIDLEIYLGIEGDAVGDAIAVLLGIPGETPDQFHFLFTLIQTIADPVDPINYAPYVIRETAHPKHVWQSAGHEDPFDPPGVNATLATGLGLDIVAPAAIVHDNIVLRGGTVVQPPMSGNRTVAGKTVTAINSQYPDGDHWVYLTDESARTQGSDFLASALGGEGGVVK